MTSASRESAKDSPRSAGFFKTVSTTPNRFGFASRLTRKAKLPKPWPYSVYFVIKHEHVEVIISTIWHGRGIHGTAPAAEI